MGKCFPWSQQTMIILHLFKYFKICQTKNGLLNLGTIYSFVPYSWREIPLTIESIDGILPHGARDPSINPLILVALVLQEILKYVQHLGHLHKVKKWQFNSMFPLAYWLQVSVNIITIYTFTDYLPVKRRGNRYTCSGTPVFSIYLGKDEQSMALLL